MVIYWCSCAKERGPSNRKKEIDYMNDVVPQLCQRVCIASYGSDLIR